MLIEELNWDENDMGAQIWVLRSDYIFNGVPKKFSMQSASPDAHLYLFFYQKKTKHGNAYG